MSSLVYLLVWSLPPHIPYISSPSQCLLFIASYLNSVFYFNITHPSDHSHLLAEVPPHFLSWQARSHFCVAYTAAIQPASPNQWYIPIGKQWYQLPELIPSNSNSGLHSCVSSIHTQHILIIMLVWFLVYPPQFFAGAKITVIPWNVGANLFPSQIHGTVLKSDCHVGASRTRLGDHNVGSCPNSSSPSWLMNELLREWRFVLCTGWLSL